MEGVKWCKQTYKEKQHKTSAQLTIPCCYKDSTKVGFLKKALLHHLPLRTREKHIKTFQSKLSLHQTNPQTQTPPNRKIPRNPRNPQFGSRELQWSRLKPRTSYTSGSGSPATVAISGSSLCPPPSAPIPSNRFPISFWSVFRF